MPREYVYPNAMPPGYEEAEPPVERVGVSIGWMKEDAGGYVQLATLKQIGADSFDPANGWYMDLDRQQINRLIRLLRRARDQAYGHDE